MTENTHDKKINSQNKIKQTNLWRKPSYKIINKQKNETILPISKCAQETVDCDTLLISIKTERQKETKKNWTNVMASKNCEHIHLPVFPDYFSSSGRN